ncbi:hypothetical protein BDN70DRAFT_887574 [Pholiota conissans]|uniref:Uncharacterized protein n=1 Tax=Pholiota conissans TaxID=109636 RepID=A0A9P5YQ58_9AGAR|nr:hypothetical protein BDN70DRAFT_887574 [Pholiota conissans]
MFSPVVLLAFFGVLASQVLAQSFPTFNITVGTMNMTAPQILQIPDSPVKTACSTNLTETLDLFGTCGDDPKCLCSSQTVSSLVNTETCMFHNLISTNSKAPSPLAGSNVVLGAYSTACGQSNFTLTANETALVLPGNWDGLYVAVLPLGATVVVVGVGAIMGFSALYILSNLE